MMKLLAIDPGPQESAWVLWDGEIRLKDKVPNERLLTMLRGGGDPRDRCAIEMIAHYGTGMPAGAEVFDTCVWIGRFMQAFGADRTTLVKRHEVKTHLCGSQRAKDGNIRQALIDRLGPQGTKRAPGRTYGVSGDVWSALAVAVTWWDRSASA